MNSDDFFGVEDRDTRTLCINCKSFYAVPAHWPCCTATCARRYRSKRRNGLA